MHKLRQIYFATKQRKRSKKTQIFEEKYVLQGILVHLTILQDDNLSEFPGHPGQSEITNLQNDTIYNFPDILVHLKYPSHRMIIRRNFPDILVQLK